MSARGTGKGQRPTSGLLVLEAATRFAKQSLPFR